MPGKNVHLNGQIVPADQAVISATDAGFLHGASAFTTMLAYKGVVFRLDRHLSRLMATVRKFSLRTDATTEGLAVATSELLAANELTEGRVRITLSPGNIGQDKPTTLVTAEPLPEYPEHWYTEGITVAVASFKQPVSDPACGHKTGCYFARVLARQEAAAVGAEEALWYTPENYLAEACFCNVFLVLGGKVHTPGVATPVLPGIVREAVIELCGQLDIQCDTESPLTVRQMLAAQEMFLTASCSGIRPVARIERHSVADEKPGKITQKIMNAYNDLLDSECAG